MDKQDKVTGRAIEIFILASIVLLFVMALSANALLFQGDNNLVGNHTVSFGSSLSNENNNGWYVKIGTNDLRLLYIPIDRSVTGSTNPNAVVVSRVACDTQANQFNYGSFPVNDSSGTMTANLYNGSEYQLLQANLCYHISFRNNVSWTATSYFERQENYTDASGLFTWLGRPYPTGTNRTFIQSVFRNMILNATAGIKASDLYPFNVSYNYSPETLGTHAIMKITTNFTNPSSFYSYALQCNFGTSTIWSALFNTGFNFSVQNTTASFSNPESFLTPYGLFYFVGDATPSFDIRKYHTSAVRETMFFDVNYIMTVSQGASFTNNTVDLFFYGSDGQTLTEWVRLNMTNSTTLRIDKMSSSGNKSVGVATIIGTATQGTVKFRLSFSPARNTSTNKEYFTEKFYTLSNDETVATLVGSSDTSNNAGRDVRDVEFFSGVATSNNTNVDLVSMKLVKGQEFPNYVGFQNGVVINNLSIPSPQTFYQGDGFQILPDYGNVFYSVCDYTSDGVYTQRHYIGNGVDLSDYSNFHDLIVFASATGNINLSHSVNKVSNTGDVAVDSLTKALADIGIVSAGTKLLIWFFLTMIVVGFFSFLLKSIPMLSVVVGVLSFVVMMIVGVFFNFVPLWVIVIFVLLSAGVVVLIYNSFFGGG